MRKNVDIKFSIIIIFYLIMLGILIWRFIFPSIGGNKKLLDLSYEFNKAIIYINGEKIELDIKRWNDYEGEQIQIETVDGKVYLVSSFNTILVNEY